MYVRLHYYINVPTHIQPHRQRFKMARSIVQGVKSKNFTFRITEALSNDIAEVNTKAKQHGLRLNMTEALTSALEREVKALQKELQKLEPTWIPGQMDLPEIENLRKK